MEKYIIKQSSEKRRERKNLRKIARTRFIRPINLEWPLVAGSHDSVRGRGEYENDAIRRDATLQRLVARAKMRVNLLIFREFPPLRPCIRLRNARYRAFARGRGIYFACRTPYRYCRR